MLSLYLHLSSLNLCLLIAAVIVINFGLDCFTNSDLTYFHIPHKHCLIISLYWQFVNWWSKLWETAPLARFYRMLGQTHVNGWSRVVAFQNGGSTSYIFPFKLRVLQWSRHLFNYWKNKKTIIEKFLILLIWNWIYTDHRKITWLWS